MANLDCDPNVEKARAYKVAFASSIWRRRFGRRPTSFAFPRQVLRHFWQSIRCQQHTDRLKLPNYITDAVHIDLGILEAKDRFHLFLWVYSRQHGLRGEAGRALDRSTSYKATVRMNVQYNNIESGWSSSEAAVKCQRDEAR